MEEKEEGKKSIFRKSAMDKVSSPEELDGYLKVTRPGVWFALAAIVVFLAGVIAWGFLGHIETTYSVAVVASENGEARCYVPLDKIEAVTEAGKIKIADKEYTVKDIGLAEDIITENDISVIAASGYNLYAGQFVKPLKIEAAELESGMYTGEAVIETIKPISFIIN